MRTTSRLTKGILTAAAPRRRALSWALCLTLVCQVLLAGPPGPTHARRANPQPAPAAAPQQSQGSLSAEAPQVSQGALSDLEQQQNPQLMSSSAAVSEETPDPLAPALTQGFDAINFNENASLTGFFQIPPDPAGAAGPTHVVNVVNSSIEWYTKGGVRQNRQSLRNFFLASPAAADPPQTGTFDPKVVYDQYANRFVVVTMERIEASGMTPNQSRVYLAVSDDSDPNGTWFKTTLQTEETIDPPGAPLPRQSWADFPGLTVDSEAVYFTTNMFAHNNQPGAGTFAGQRLWILAKAPWYTGLPAVQTRYDPAALADANPAGDSIGIATTMQPTHMYGDTPGGLGTFLLAYSGLNGGGQLFVQIIQVDNPLAPTPTFTGYLSNWGTVAANDSLAGFPGAPQAGTTRRIATNDRRFSQHGVYRNGLLYAAAPILPPTGPDAGQVTAHYFVFDPAVTNVGPTDPPPVDQGNIGGETIAPGTYTFFPSVAVDEFGDLAVGFAASAPSIFPGSYYTGRLAADPPGTTQPPSALRPGQDYYVRAFSTSMTVTSRWGDYTGIWLDPLTESTFWVYNEHALPRGTVLASVGPHEDGRWGTAWGSFSLVGAPPLKISEFRPRGPNGELDEFIEIYNNSDSPHTVAALDASGGYAVVAEDGVVRCTIPNGTIIPARGHFLCGNGLSYSIRTYAELDLHYPLDTGDAQGIALFSTANPAGFDVTNRLDAFGYTSSPALYREGAGFPFVLSSNVEQSFFRSMVGNTTPKDTNDNGADFIAVNAQPNIVNYGLVLGAPGPENLTSPIQRNAQIDVALLDPAQAASAAPNRERNSSVVPNGSLGTLIIRRTVTNNTGAPITRLRFRVADITTLNTPTAAGPGLAPPCTSPPCADLRALSSPDEAAIGTSMGAKSTSGLDLEIPPQQPLGGGYNSSLDVRQVKLATPLANGASVNVNFRLGVNQNGSFRFFVNVEALP